MNLRSLFKISLITTAFALATAIFVTSCATFPRIQKNVSRNIYDFPVMTEAELYGFFMRNNPSASRAKVRRLAHYYVVEGAIEGINSDIAFVQMCHETGFLRFGNLVTADMNNFCGLGAIDAEHRGLRFETEQLGVRAHIQHLHAYATDADVPLTNRCIDPRYKYVNPRGKAKTIFELAGTWAADRQYGQKLDSHLTRLENGE